MLMARSSAEEFDPAADVRAENPVESRDGFAFARILALSYNTAGTTDGSVGCYKDVPKDRQDVDRAPWAGIKLAQRPPGRGAYRKSVV